MIDAIRFIEEASWLEIGSDERFSEVAIQSFRRQCKRIPEYRRFAFHMGRNPDQVQDWREIPPVPVSAFRSHRLSAAALGKEAVTFATSGTTVSRRGWVSLRSTALYEASIRRSFTRHLLPDGAFLPSIIFGPPRVQAPHSSLWFMGDIVGVQLSAGGLWIVKGQEPHWEIADAAFQRAESEGRPVLLFGTTLLFQAYLTRCRRERIRFDLPKGSRAMDTGGAKGTQVEVSRYEVETAFDVVLGVWPTHLVNEYGMAEMGSQFYEDKLLAEREGRPALAGFTIPPWVRTRVLDPETMRERPAGMNGLLVHYDLANYDVPIAIQTEDVGSVSNGRLILEGRLPEAERRGCSLPFEKFVEQERNRA